MPGSLATASPMRRTGHEGPLSAESLKAGSRKAGQKGRGRVRAAALHNVHRPEAVLKQLRNRSGTVLSRSGTTTALEQARQPFPGKVLSAHGLLARVLKARAKVLPEPRCAQDPHLDRRSQFGILRNSDFANILHVQENFLRFARSPTCIPPLIFVKV